MLLVEAINFCKQTANIWQLLGYVVMIFKIIVPLLLIIFGMVDLGKAVISSDEQAVNKAVGSLIQRFVAAVVVFFIPTIISAIFNAVALMDETEQADYNVCAQCITNVNGDNCADYAVCAKYGFESDKCSMSLE